MIDLEQAERFVELLTGAPTSPIVLQIFDDSKIRADLRLARVLIGTVRQHAPLLSKANDNGCGVFIQIGAGPRRGIAGVTGPRALFADDDAVPEAFRISRDEKVCPRCGQYHSNELPLLIDLPPTMVVQSSANEQNRHYYWRLKPGADLARWAEAQAQIACSLKTDSSMINVDRVMRLPGTMNRKVDPKKGRDGTPFLVRIIEEDELRIYDLADETLSAFPDPPNAGGTIASSGMTIDFEKGSLLDATGSPVTAPGAIPAIAGPVGPPTPAALKAAKRIREWLGRQQVEYDRRKSKKNPLLFVLKFCVFNAEHQNVMALMVQPTGAIWGGCFHESCQSNSQRWEEIAKKIGGWGLAEPQGFRLGSQTEIAQRLLADLGTGTAEELVYAEGAFWRYSALAGTWGKIEEFAASRIIQSYDGRAIGDSGKRLLVDRRHVTGALALAQDRASQPDFFADRATGIVFTNGFVTVDTKGIHLEPATASLRAQSAMPFGYDVNAERPRFNQFLEEIFAPDPDAELKRALLQEFAGAALMGLATRYEAALFLPGSGANGKSVTLRIIKALFPTGTVSSVRPQDFGNEYYRAFLVGVRLNVVTETPEGELLASEDYKAVVSGEAISARHPAGRPFIVVPIAAHWFAANTLPPPSDSTWGFLRKVTILPFNRTFAAGEKDEYLSDYIIDNELPGVAAWAIEGARRLVARGGYSAVASSDEAKVAWQREADVVMLFIDECCGATPSGQLISLETETEVNDLYQHFKAWCRYTGHTKQLSKHKFTLRLGKLGLRGRSSNGQTLYSLVVSNPPPSPEYH